MSEHSWKYIGLRQDMWAWVGGIAIFSLIGSTRLWMGQLYNSATVVRLLEAIESPALFFASALAASSTTSLALMLTLLGFTHRMDVDFDDEFFQRIYRIGLYSTITLCGAVLLIVGLIFPLGEFEDIPKQWYPQLYNVVLFLVASLAMLIFVTVILLFTTIRRLIEMTRSSRAGAESDAA